MKRSMKKVLSFVMALTMVFGMVVPALAAEAHVHEYTTTIVEPTCTAEGYTLKKCACGDEYRTDITEKLDHEMTVVAPAKDATCTSDALLEGKKCAHCDYTEQEAVAGTMLEHDLVIKVDQSNCESAGKVYEACKNCDFTHTLKVLPHSTDGDGEHEMIYTITKAPTCSTAGTATYTCTDCDLSYNVYVAPSAELHDWEDVFVAPDCETDGKDGQVCKNCNKFVGTMTKAYGHKAGATYLFEVEPTCYEDGYYWYACIRCTVDHETDCTDDTHAKCDKLFKVPSNKKAQHNWGSTTVVEGTHSCTGAEMEYKVCEDCGYKQLVDSDLAAGHTWAKSEAENIPAQGSTPAKIYFEVIAPTCQEFGYTIYTCKVCGVQKKDDYVAKKAHSYTVYDCEDASCTEDACNDCTHAGRVVKCDMCDAVSTEDVCYTEHAWTVASTVPSTCTAYAYNNLKCTHTNCTATDVAEPTAEQIAAGYYTGTDANRHTAYEEVGRTEPTCTEDGEAYGYCKNCDHIDRITITLKAPGHQWTPHAAVASTCETQGNIAYKTCGRGTCGAIADMNGKLLENLDATKLPIDKTNHSAACLANKDATGADAWVVVGERPATCVVKGAKIYKTTCGVYYFDEAGYTTDASKHDNIVYDGADDTNPTTTSALKNVANLMPTCTVAGTHGYTICENCGKITAIDLLALADCSETCKADVGTPGSANYKPGTHTVLTTKFNNGTITVADLAIAAYGHAERTNARVEEQCNDEGTHKFVDCSRCDAILSVDTENCDSKSCSNAIHNEIQAKLTAGTIVAADLAIRAHAELYRVSFADDDADCVNAGIIGGTYCEKCQKDAWIEEALGHDIAVTGVVVECDKPGYVVYKCQREGCTDNAWHDLDRDGKVDVYPFAPQNYVAPNFATALPGAVLEYKFVPVTEAKSEYNWFITKYEAPTEHNWVAQTDVEATCGARGYKWEQCSICLAEKIIEYIPQKDHATAAGTVIDLSCKSDLNNYIGLECVNGCGITVDANTVRIHNLIHVIKEVNCTEQGYDFYTCEDCDKMFEDETAATELTEIPYAGIPAHGYKETVSYTPATSLADGAWVYICDACGETITETLYYQHKVIFDIEVTPYFGETASEDYTFVNNGFILVTIYATADNFKFTTLDYRFNYDSDVYKVVSSDFSYDFGANGGNYTQDNGDNVAFITVNNGDDKLVLDGKKVVLGTVLLKNAIGNFDIDEYDIWSTVDDIVFDEDAHADKIVNNIESVEFALIGDANGDYNYTLTDARAIQLLYLNGEYDCLADVNLDGAVDLADYVAIRKFVASNQTVADYYEMVGYDTSALDTFEHGDYSEDGFITNADAAIFDEAYAEWLDAPAYIAFMIPCTFDVLLEIIKAELLA